MEPEKSKYSLRSFFSAFLAREDIRKELSIEERGRRKLFVIFQILIIIPLIFFGMEQMRKGMYIYGISDLIMVGLLTGFILILRRLKNGKNIFRITLFFLELLLLYWVKTGAVEGYASIWIITTPPFIFFLMGRKEGFLWVMSYFIFTLLFFLNPGSFFDSYPYAYNFISRHIATLLVVVFITYHYESVREQYKEGMETEQGRLVHERNLLAEAQEALKDHRDHLEELVGERTAEIEEKNIVLQSTMRELEETNYELTVSKEELAMSENRYRLLADTVTDLIWSTDMNLAFMYISPSVKTMYGYTVEEAMKSPLDRLNTPDSYVRLRETYLEQIALEEKGTADPERNIVLELEQVRKDGSTFMVESKVSFIRDSNMKAIGIVGISRDISERIKAQQEKENIRIYLRNIIDSMPSMLIAVDDEGRITEWNNAAASITGVRSQQAIDRKFWEVVPQLEKFKSEYKKVIRSKFPKEFHREIFEEAEGLVRPEEETVYYNISLFPLTSIGVQGLVIRLDDISELEKKEQQLRQTQKMDTIGTLSGGLAHDFNNILGGISAPLSVLIHKFKNSKPVGKDYIQRLLNAMNESVQRAADMVQQLLAVSRKQETSLVPVDLRETIKHVMKICANAFDKSIELLPEQYDEKAMVRADLTQIEQVLLNLCVNASHAMTIMREEGEKQGGKLSVAIEKIVSDKIFRASHPRASDGEYWVLSVRDTGVGMDKKTEAKIFDPFYTTKPPGKGTGLGLAMVYNIIEQHNGFIDLYSAIGHGSTFNIYLPVLGSDEIEEIGEKEVEIKKGEGLVMVVEDDEIIRETARTILEECGFDVIQVEDGITGIELFKQYQNAIKLVILDMVMPKMSGEETYLEMKKIKPGVKVLMTSGFKQDERVEKVLKLGLRGFVQKPYTIEKLAKAVFDILDLL
ncbi:MAG: PAS domain S-box protein [bacterium]|nr:PAS domain S-box protein [bacterium]